MTISYLFSYFGTKSRIAHLYPPPRHDTIIEPFAGSAAYSCLYPDRNVILVEKNPRIAAILRWLIHVATPEIILGLPTFEKSKPIIHSNSVVRDFLSFENNRCSAQTKNVAGLFVWGNRRKRIISETVTKINHWKVIEGDYTSAPNIPATHFVDPPYLPEKLDGKIIKNRGYCYPCSSRHIDYEKLAEWCRSRQGQVIVCEGSGADWLPFRPLVTHRTSAAKAFEEVMWTNITKDLPKFQESLAI